MLQNTDKGGKSMVKCCKCKKNLTIFTKFEHNGKIYCSSCEDKLLANEKKQKQKERDKKAELKAVGNAYYRNKKKFLKHLITNWKPRGCKTETQYTKSLREYLQNNLTPDDIYVSSEHGLSMSRVDVVIGQKKPYRDFAIELKKDFIDSSEFDRLKGQIHTYVTSGFENVIVLNVGKIKPKLETELKHYFKDMEDNYYRSSNFNSIELIKK